MPSVLNGRTLRSIAPICGLTTGAALLLLAPSAQATEGKTPGQPLPAQAGDFTLKLEAGVAMSLSAPQSQLFKIGGGQTIKALWAIDRYFDLGPSATFVYLPSETSPGDPGTAWAFGAGGRIKRPHDAPDSDDSRAISPWLDVDLLYVRTGVLNRPGFAAAAGLAVPLGKSRVFWLGPFVRYFHILQGEKAGFDNHDAKILSVGLSLEMGSGIEREREPERAAVAAPEPRTIVVNKEVIVNKEVPVCPDRDQDGVPDQVDRCPDVVGSADGWGCPEYKKIVVKRDKLELKEKLYFAWNQGTLKESSYPVLDEVVKALNDNKGFRVQIEGHSSSEGGDERNQTLSELRANAVLDYLVAHGIGKERLVTKGFGGSVPIDTNATPAGRENNRRVEFVVHFIIVNDGSKQ